VCKPFLQNCGIRLFWRGAQAHPEEIWNKNYSEEVHKSLLKNCGIKTILRRCTSLTWRTME
jgi:hypothetical protein